MIEPNRHGRAWQDPTAKAVALLEDLLKWASKRGDLHTPVPQECGRPYTRY
jgi:hypothetical protein